MELKQAIRDYMTAHRVNNDSPDTLKNYRYVLPRFADWLAPQSVTDTDQLRLNHLRGWVVYLQDKPIKHNGEKLNDTTVQMYAKHILAFCHCLEQEEIIEKPITTRFKLPRVEKQAPRACSLRSRHPYSDMVGRNHLSLSQNWIALTLVVGLMRSPHSSRLRRSQ